MLRKPSAYTQVPLPMKNAKFAWPALLALIAAGCSSDLVVKSDLGEQVVIKDSAVSSKAWDSSGFLSSSIELFEKTKSKYEACYEGSVLSQEDCWRIWGTTYARLESRVETLQAMADSKAQVILVKYRPISIDLNGKKNASSDYTQIACLSKSNSREEDQIATKAAEEADLEIGTKSRDGSVQSEVYKTVCKKYTK